MAERESLEVDVLIVGGGPAGLAAAYHLRKLNKDLSIAVLEKGKEIGAHIISGAVMDPHGINELMPDWKEKGGPIESPVQEDHVLFLTRNRKFNLPIIPAPLQNHGNYVISLNKFTRWFGEQVEESGVDIFAGFAGAELLIEGDTVVGVRTGDKGIDKLGHPKGNFELGIDVRAKITILAEGARGSLTKQLIRKFNLDKERNPQVFAVGVKEVWDVPKEENNRGRVIHTMGWPLRNEEFGGGFIYNMAEGRVSIGFVIGLDYLDPRLDPHQRFQQFKTHPYIRSILEGGKLFSYGAKTIPEGGYWALPQYYFNGGMIIGDAAGFLNAMRLKGIHLAFKTGMLAAQAAFEALEANDVTAKKLKRFGELVESSWVKQELWKVRNFHQAFEHGFFAGMIHTGLQMVTGGRGLRNRYRNQPGHARMRQLKEYYDGHVPPPTAASFDGKLTFDKLTDVFNSGTDHDEDQPCHLHVLQPDICHPRCTNEYGNPCQFFCPAAVYEMVENGNGARRLQINFSNCVHCKTCDVMDPYEVINWVTPEGGGGPGYELL
ncbi:MAG TPA: electron transfer flavoprotein-ubiquinone oxidoreductase [Terriglobia bacterium]|nr:electron transfer flavoprotein-ubiquinone oxidoreductase [Terriglobia bacterium]